MPISGLVITFQAAVSEGDHERRAVEAIPEVEVGDSHANKLAIVIDSDTPERDREIWDEIRRLPRVADLSVAMIGFDDDR